MSKISMAFIALVLLPSLSVADDIVLKDGKRITWKTLTDDGTSYSVETVDGKKLTVKKSQVERITVGAQAANTQPLTGASFAVDPKKVVTVDLLPKAKTEATKGAWVAQPGMLSNTGENTSRVTVFFDHEISGDYDMTLRVERVSGKGGLDVGLTYDGFAGAYFFDAFDSASSMFGMVDDDWIGSVKGNVFQAGKPRTVKISVRKDAVLVQVDGKDYWKSRVDWKTITLHKDLKAEPGKLFLTSYGGGWKVSVCSLTHAK